MDTLDRLENSITRLVEAHLKLRMESEHYSGEMLLVGAELEQARETVAGLKAELERYVRDEVRYREFDSRKEELRDQIKSIIEKIDRYDDQGGMDAITNA